MSLIYCRSCGHRISDLAPACPRCGELAVNVPAGQQLAGIPSPLPQSAVAIARLLDKCPPLLLGAGVVLLLMINGLVLASFLFSDEPWEGDTIGGRPAFIHSSDGRIQIEVPPNWNRMPNEAPSSLITIAGHGGDAWVVVFADYREASGPIDGRSDQLEAYTERARQALVHMYPGGTNGDLFETTVGGLDAFQWTFQGRWEDNELTLLQTVVETPSVFYEIRALAPSSRFQAYLDEFVRVTSSFRIHTPPEL